MLKSFIRMLKIKMKLVPMSEEHFGFFSNKWLIHIASKSTSYSIIQILYNDNKEIISIYLKFNQSSQKYKKYTRLYKF